MIRRIICGGYGITVASSEIEPVLELDSESGLNASQIHSLKDITNKKRLSERVAAYKLIGTLLDTPFIICHRTGGIPYLADADGTEMKVNISISHSDSVIVAALSDKLPVGIDVQGISDKIGRVSQKFLLEEEMELLHDSRSLLMAWTIKEAGYKAMATEGLPLKDIVITGTPAICEDSAGTLYRTPVCVTAGFTKTKLEALSWFDTLGRAYSLAVLNSTVTP